MTLLSQELVRALDQIAKADARAFRAAQRRYIKARDKAREAGKVFRGTFRPPTKFDVDLALELADEVLDKPPELAFTERVAPVGEFVFRFALPLHCAQPVNRTQQAPGWKYAQDRTECYARMLAQVGSIWPEPLPGRPMVRAIRFSSNRGDKLTHWSKMPVDLLQAPRRTQKKNYLGLGFIRSDSIRDCDCHQWSEYLPSSVGLGFCTLEVWSGR